MKATANRTRALLDNAQVGHAVGFTELIWWKAILALVSWPYFLDAMAR